MIVYPIKKIINISFVIFVFFVLNSPAFAQEISIKENATASNNQINVSTTNSNEVSQTQSTKINNQVESNASTGTNTSSFNNGDTNQNSGSTSVTTTIENSANKSQVSLGCCQDSTSQTTITSNGPFSQNRITIDQQAQTSINIVQDANLNNQVTNSLNTGNNSSSFNSSDSRIQTGDIMATNTILNDNINTAKIIVGGSFPSNTMTKIADNGAFSENEIALSTNHQNIIQVLNRLSLDNIINNLLNTGNNISSFNNGDSEISTGDIFLNNILKNVNINSSMVEISCGCLISENVSPPLISDQPKEEITEEKEDENEKEDVAQEEALNDNEQEEENEEEEEEMPRVLGASATSEMLPETGDNLLIGLSLLFLLTFVYGAKLSFFPSKSGYQITRALNNG